MMSPRSPSRSTSFKRIACVTWRLRLSLGYVRKESEFAGALDRLRQLALVPAACSGDPRGADLPLLAHRPAKRGEVLVVDHVDLVPAELARLPAASAEPRNWTESAMMSTLWRFWPSCVSHSRHSRRPSIATGRPFWRYCAQFSPCAPQTVTSK